MQSQQIASLGIANLLLLGMVRRGRHTGRLLDLAVVRTELTRRRRARSTRLMSQGRRGGRTMWTLVRLMLLLVVLVMVLWRWLLVAAARNLVIIDAADSGGV